MGLARLRQIRNRPGNSAIQRNIEVQKDVQETVLQNYSLLQMMNLLKL